MSSSDKLSKRPSLASSTMSPATPAKEPSSPSAAESRDCVPSWKGVLKACCCTCERCTSEKAGGASATGLSAGSAASSRRRRTHTPESPTLSVLMRPSVQTAAMHAVQLPICALADAAACSASRRSLGSPPATCWCSSRSTSRASSREYFEGSTPELAQPPTPSKTPAHARVAGGGGHEMMCASSPRFLDGSGSEAIPNSTRTAEAEQSRRGTAKVSAGSQ
mmetsp:Transcript_4989/g.12911  ORF Transcript_4989/g.12911 Transcript_4989/m.12911 type:complete len:221 (-) Transcript_4989:68-730(-)